jgi:hypothetical protein
MGLLAAALLWLHREALKAFREELAEERKASQTQHAALLAVIEHRHDEQLEAHKETRHVVNEFHNEWKLAEERQRWRLDNDTE